MLDPHGDLSIAELVFFAPALCISLVVVVRHGFSRQLGWFYLVLLALLRIVGASCLLYAESNSDYSTDLLETYAITSSIGTAPLLLAWMGFLTRINQDMERKGVPLLAFRPLHLISLVALVLAIIGGVTNAESSSDTAEYTTGRDLRQAAAIIWLFMYVALGLIALWSLQNRSHVIPAERTLLYACIIVTPFLLVRMLYTIISAFVKPGSIFFFTAFNVYVQAFMQFLMEAIVVMCFVVAGLLTPQTPQRSLINAGKTEQGYGQSEGRFRGVRAPQQPKTGYRQPSRRLGDYRPSRLIMNAIKERR